MSEEPHAHKPETKLHALGYFKLFLLSSFVPNQSRRGLPVNMSETPERTLNFQGFSFSLENFTDMAKEIITAVFWWEQ